MSKIKIDFSQLSHDGSKIDPAGINLDFFKQNPIVTHNFDQLHPIGIAENIQMHGNFLTIDLKFDKHEVSPNDIKMYEAFLNREGVLIGKPAICWNIDEDKKEITQCKLMSVSL